MGRCFAPHAGRAGRAAAAIKATGYLCVLDGLLPIREILKTAEPVHHMDPRVVSVRHLDVLPEPIMQGCLRPCTEKRISPYCADCSEQHVPEISTLSESSKVHVALEP
ncbi:hypothetical protein J3B01_004219 [Coemansia erecta]|nr:hypothetical protein J3B01_004219 [Coemansia erecta]